jgi:hypothetical protein
LRHLTVSGDTFRAVIKFVAQHFSCGRCGEKFPLAHEVSRHVRAKACKFYKTIQSPACTITSDEVAQSSSCKGFSLITPDTIKFQSEKVPECLEQGLDLIDGNFTDLLSTSTFGLVSSSVNDEHEFGLMIGDIGSEHEEVEVSFACKVCGFR